MSNPTERRAGFWNRRFEGVTGFIVVVVLASLGIVGALLLRNDQSAAPPAAKANVHVVAGTSYSSPTSGLTGFGATDAAWNVHHREDARFAPGAAYDPDPSLDRYGDGRYTARYFDVSHADGRVLDYQMRFPPGTNIEQAKRYVLAEFPSDTRIVWFKRRHWCAQMFVQSRNVARATHTHGAALIEFGSGVADDQYDPNGVWTALVMGIAPPASNLPC